MTRVGRDPWRKLGLDERLIGAARLCLAQGVPATAILRHVLDACTWQPAAEEPQAGRWRELQARGPVALLVEITGLAPSDPLLQQVEEIARGG